MKIVDWIQFEWNVCSIWLLAVLFTLLAASKHWTKAKSPFTPVCIYCHFIQRFRCLLRFVCIESMHSDFYEVTNVHIKQEQAMRFRCTFICGTVILWVWGRKYDDGDRNVQQTLWLTILSGGLWMPRKVDDRQPCVEAIKFMAHFMATWNEKDLTESSLSRDYDFNTNRTTATNSARFVCVYSGGALVFIQCWCHVYCNALGFVQLHAVRLSYIPATNWLASVRMQILDHFMVLITFWTFPSLFYRLHFHAASFIGRF